jgi:hypothetical protein
MRESFTEILLPLFSIINIAFSYRQWLAQHDVLHNIMVFFLFLVELEKNLIKGII